MTVETDSRIWVGPVLQAEPLSRAVIAAIIELNPLAQIVDHGAYVRVLAPECCRVSRAAIERHIGQTFHFPSDLERLMPSFKGIISINEDEIVWLAVENGGR